MAVGRGSARLGARRVGCSEVLVEAETLVAKTGTIGMDKVDVSFVDSRLFRKTTGGYLKRCREPVLFDGRVAWRELMMIDKIHQPRWNHRRIGDGMMDVIYPGDARHQPRQQGSIRQSFRC